MALTLNKLRFEILELFNLYSDDINLDYRLIDQIILEKRTKYFYQQYNKLSNTIPSTYYQEFCTKVQLVDSSECCTETGCSVLRTVEKIPQIMSLADGEIISRVSKLGLESKSYTIISQFRIPYFGKSRYNKQAIAAVYYNDYVYLISKDNFYYPQIEKIVVRAVFRDPKEAGKFRLCEDRPCWTEDSPYPLEERLWEIMKSDMLSNDFRLKLTTPHDNINDNQDNLTDLTRNEGTKG